MAQIDEIFEQVDEQLEADRYEKFWKENSGRIIGTLVAFFLVLFAYVGWKEYRTGQEESASELYLAAIGRIEQGDLAVAGKYLDNLQDGYGSMDYAVLGQLIKARVLHDGGDDPGAIRLLEGVAGSPGSSETLADLARLNAAYLVAGKDEAGALGYLAKIPAQSPFKAHALELQGLISEQKGEGGKALAYLKEAKLLQPGGALGGRIDRMAERLEAGEKK
ncbi:MAG: tetratricopeptide repeat protein [Magnetococcales bacterium]|nr:tetratricopeptide repeat protein [Magnetococcales bacterium]